MKFWTLSLADSGRFEDPGSTRDAKAPEGVALIVGAVLAPGEANFLDTVWRKPLRNACNELGVPFPPQPGALESSMKPGLVAAASEALEKAGARLLFVVAPPPEKPDPDLDFARYIRMLGDAVDLSVRIAALEGCEVLDIRPAQRSVPLSDEKAARARKKGFAVPGVEGAGTRAMAEAELRQTLDALAREPAGALPPRAQLKSVEVVSARDPQSHPGTWLAAIACNHVYARLANTRTPDVSGRVPGVGDVPAWVVARDALAEVRDTDRALRARPPDVMRAFRAVAKLDGHARGSSTELSPFRMAREGAAGVARRITDQGLALLPSGGEEPFARALAAHANAHLASKSGDYEGTWRALDAGWFGDGVLARRVRTAIDDRELRAQLARLVLECANHRGDVDAGRRAREMFDETLAGGVSLALLAERLHVRNLSSVMTQNRLPAEATETAAVLAQLAREAKEVLEAADEAGAITRRSAVQGHGAVQPELEDALWQALSDGPPRWEPSDRERGRCYGTAARSLAFVGDLDSARTTALLSRAFFRDSPFDLRFNAAVIARIELEAARLEGSRKPPDRALMAALELAACNPLRRPAAFVEEVARDPARRFALDLALRTFLWTAVRPGAWIEALTDTGKQSLFAILSAGELRSHPTELIARHAAEVLPKSEAKRWFDLSLAVCEEAPPGTMRRFGAFTAHLAKGGAAQGPPASVLNPVFEFR